AGLTFTAAAGAGQDLGSSNKFLLGVKKSGPPPKATKKTPPKSKAKPEISSAKKSVAKKPPSTAATKAKTPPKKSTETSSKATRVENRPATPTKKVEIASAPPAERFQFGSATDEELFEDLIEQGNVARDDRNYAAAEAAYEKARPIKPRDWRAVYGLGNLYADQHRWEEAEKAYRTALQIEPGFAITYVALSFVLTQPVIAPNLPDRYKESERHARKAIQLAPSNAMAFDQLGVALELRGQIGAETESAYRTAIKLNPGFAPAYAHLGRLLRRRGLTRESESLYKQAIERSTDIATVADIMQSEQRFAQSEKLLNNALKEDPRNPSALLLLGRALTALGRFDGAEAALKKNLAVSNNGFMGRSLLAALYLRRGDPQAAERMLSEALAFAGSFGKLRLSRQFEEVGDAYMKSFNRPMAERAYRRAIDLDAERDTLAAKLSRARFR
ncbi:MAG TPA: tetratricopeptide repeat protein, partial [Pyrinomonadaceae bacterium]|nr:tetratricopeptide repeat protein [Pyrinomonadaceae bacterium]